MAAVAMADNGAAPARGARQVAVAQADKPPGAEARRVVSPMRRRATLDLAKKIRTFHFDRLRVLSRRRPRRAGRSEARVYDGSMD